MELGLPVCIRVVDGRGYRLSPSGGSWGASVKRRVGNGSRKLRRQEEGG